MIAFLVVDLIAFEGWVFVYKIWVWLAGSNDIKLDFFIYLMEFEIRFDAD